MNRITSTFMRILVVTLLVTTALTTARSQDMKVAEEQISRKWAEVKNKAGEPRDICLISVGAGYYRQYTNGRIYFRPGFPPLYIYGFIGDRYSFLRGPESWLGWPTSEEQDFTENGRVTTFEHGSIYWWPDTGAPIEMGDIAVRYTGLHCFGETDNDQLSGADEPYVIFGVIKPPVIIDGNPKVETSVPWTKIYEGVDAGESRADNIEFYRGLPYGMSISATLFEHDFSDPKEYHGAVKESADKASEGIIAAAKGIPTIGPVLAVAMGILWKAIGEKVVDEIHGLLDTKDDNIDTKSFVITAKQMITLAGKRRKNLKEIEWHLDSPLLSGDGSSYKVYFVIDAVEPPSPATRVVRMPATNDFNDDGKADILWHNASTGESQIWMMCGSSRAGRATIVNGANPALIGLPWKIVGSNDFNQDRKTDLLWYNINTGESQIWYMNGNKFSDRATVLGQNGTPVMIGLPWSIVGSRDFNEDYKTDLLWHNATSGETQIWFMNGHRISDKATVLDENGKAILIGLPWRIVGANNFNQDGKADILWHNGATGATQIWFMNGYKINGRTTVLNENGKDVLIGLPWRIVGTNDFNQDGAADILWHNGSTGETQMWFIKGGSITQRVTVDAVRDGGGSLVGIPWSIMSH